jgi:hypothetical protein
MGESSHRSTAAAGQHCVGAAGDRRERGAQNLIGGHGFRKAKRSRDNNALRARAHAPDVGSAADDHFNPGRLRGSGLFGRLSRDLRSLLARVLQGAKTCDGLGALDLAPAEIEDARHQPFLSFLA